MPEMPSSPARARHRGVPQQPAAPTQEFDPAGSTQMFRAFVAEGESASAANTKRVWGVIGLAVVVAVIAVVVWAAL